MLGQLEISSERLTVKAVEALYAWAAFTNGVLRIENNPNIGQDRKFGLLKALSELLATPHLTRDVVRRGAVDIPNLRNGNPGIVFLPEGWKAALAQLSDLGIRHVPVFNTEAQAALLQAVFKLLGPLRTGDPGRVLTREEASAVRVLLHNTTGHTVVEERDARPEIAPAIPDNPAETREIYNLLTSDEDLEKEARNSAELFAAASESEERRGRRPGGPEDDEERRSGGGGGRPVERAPVVQ